MEELSSFERVVSWRVQRGYLLRTTQPYIDSIANTLISLRMTLVYFIEVMSGHTNNDSIILLNVTGSFAGIGHERKSISGARVPLSF